MSQKIKEYVRIVVVSILVSVLIKHINFDMQIVQNILSNDFVKTILTFAAGAVVVLLITKLKKRRR